RQALRVLGADEDDSVLSDVFLDVFGVVVPIVRLKSILDERTVKCRESVGRLLNEFHEIRSQDDDYAKPVVDRCRCERDHRDRFSTLNAPVQQARWALAARSW